MHDHIQEDIIFLMFYASVAMLSLIACCYLLFRRANAIAPDVMSPLRLRRWTAAFFAAIALCHLWYLPMFFLTSPDDKMLGSLIAGLLDSMTVIPLTIVILLVMLQDRRRPLWPVAVMVAPLVVGNAFSVATRSDVLLPVLFVYFLLMWLGLIIYMVRAIRQYGRWLRDNYADLEHKEVWQGFVVLVIFFLVYTIYSLDAGELIYEFATEVINIVLICYLLWRVETLNDLSFPVNDAEDLNVPDKRGNGISPGESFHIRNSIGSLLQQHCVDKQLYLQHDLTLLQLTQAIGTNRYYLSQYFASQGTTYNDYINDLRINHFVSLYREAVDSKRSITAQQLAQKSGYRSYNTFRNAFKRKTGQSATAWMKAAERKQAGLEGKVGEP
jgi:AraC-like DNA-binding protein